MRREIPRLWLLGERLWTQWQRNEAPFIRKPLSGGFCCCSEAGGNPRRWGQELRPWQWPVGAFWTCEWEDETVLATLLTMSVWLWWGCCLWSQWTLLAGSAAFCLLLCISLWEACLNWGDLNIPLCCWACQAWRCVLFPTRKVRSLGANLFSEMNPYCLSLVSDRLKQLSAIAVLSTVSKCVAFFEKGNTCRLCWRKENLLTGWTSDVNIYLNGKFN